MTLLLPALQSPTGPAASREAVRFGDLSLTYAELAAASAALAARIADAGRVAVWATPTAGDRRRGGGGAAGRGTRRAAQPEVRASANWRTSWPTARRTVVLAGPGDALPAGAGRAAARDGGRAGGGVRAPEGYGPAASAAAEAPALIVYTSGTTGPPKGAVLPRRAIAATLDALADAWQWTGDDVLVHALPLFHVHGLILGVLGPLRRGGSVRHLGRFSTEGVARELTSGGTMLFGVPTMYHRLAEALATATPDARREALAGARLLVSGSAALPVHDHERIAAATGARVIERYGMTETLMNTSVRADGEPRPGTVGVPLPGVELRLVEEDGTAARPVRRRGASARSRCAARTSSPST